MTLLIIRHGQSEGDILNVHEGRADFSLTSLGEKQAEAVSVYIKDHWNVTGIYASPLRRTTDVAEKLSAATDIPVTYEDDLMEFDNGLLAGHSFGYRGDYDTMTPENREVLKIETMEAFRARCAEILHRIINESLTKESADAEPPAIEPCIVIITHDGVINQFYQEMMNSPALTDMRFGTSNTGIHEWRIKNGRTQVVHANLTEHLTDELVAEAAESHKLRVSYFAGGCFWCITPIFKLYKAKKSLCGYSGGDEVNPTYEEVKKQKTSHRETIAAEYDPAKVSYERLVDIFLANVDPFDDGGQFIDRGHSYTLALYYTNEEERQIAEKKIADLEDASGKKACIALEPFKNFYEAETYHQDYYLKNPEAFEKELIESGRKQK